MALEPRLEMKLEQKLSLKQRLKLQAKILGLRLRLIGKINNETYKPHAVCPRCSRRLTPFEIVKGFKRDVDDYTTKCPRCRNRFEPKIICRPNTGLISATAPVTLQFFCPSQTLNQLRGKERLTPAVFQKNYPALFRCATVHFGGLPQAFKEIGINYQLAEPVVKWEKKVKSFLGLLHDSVIARLVRVKYVEVRKLRLRLNIPRYHAENLL
jgi:hypothetical protein